MRVAKSVLLVALVTACSDPVGSFGRITEDAKTAFRNECKPGVEIESHDHLLAWGLVLEEGSDVRILKCVAPSEHEDGFLVFNLKTDDLIYASVIAEQQRFDEVVARVLGPALDKKQQRAYDDLRSSLAHPTELGELGDKRWTDGGVWVEVTDLTYRDRPNPRASPLTFEFMMEEFARHPMHWWKVEAGKIKSEKRLNEAWKAETKAWKLEMKGAVGDGQEASHATSSP